jgi:hypothetical protein
MAECNVDNPTWETPIRDFFNQIDISHMMEISRGWPVPLDLGSYASVKAHGQEIYDDVSADNMPRPPSELWSDTMKACFKKWMDNGYPES